MWLYFYPSSQEKNKKKYELESVAVELDLEDQSLFCDYNTSIYGGTSIHQLLSLLSTSYMYKGPCYMTDAGYMLYIYCPSSVL